MVRVGAGVWLLLRMVLDGHRVLVVQSSSGGIEMKRLTRPVRRPKWTLTHCSRCQALIRVEGAELRDGLCLMCFQDDVWREREKELPKGPKR